MAKEKFEDALHRLEALVRKMESGELSLEESLKAFEEGIKLARSLEKDLDKLEGRVQVLMNGADAPESGDEKPELDLFSDAE